MSIQNTDMTQKQTRADTLTRTETQEAELKLQEKLAPFRESLRGEQRKVELIKDPALLEILQTRHDDENEFDTYKNSFFSQNFALPIRKLCPWATFAAPGIEDTYVVTEVI